MTRRALCSLVGLSLTGAFVVATPAQARITRIVIARTESPTFQGTTFGDAGPYEKLVGRAVGEIDPEDPKNAVIADIRFAPRNARGMVEYSTDLYILRPIDRSRGNHRVFLEISNRGRALSIRSMNDASPRNDPTTAADAGNGFLMRQGYTIVLSGSDVTAAAGSGRLTMTVPVARNPDGSSITGPALEEFVIDNTSTLTGALTYPAATLDQAQASLTVRTLYSDTPTLVPAGAWQYVNDRTVRLLPEGTPFQKGTLYEFTYRAKDPPVAGLAFAGVRDLAVFLRRAKTDDAGVPNPAGAVERVYSFGVSQSARFAHDFLYFGFNQDEQGRKAFDGMLNLTGGASGGFFNYRFAQPGRTHRHRIARWYPEVQFPFANNVIFDQVTGRTDGRLRRCLATNSCPRIFEVNTENEYWAKAMSLLTVDTEGRDLPDMADVRSYLISNLPHAASADRAALCQQPTNPLVPNPTLRALLVALDEWVSKDENPPPSRVPRVADGTLVPPIPQAGVGFPLIPGVAYNGRFHSGDLFEFGPAFDEGILTVVPPRLVGSPYPAFVPRTDGDGHDVAGIRQVEVAVPVATYTGWALRAGPAAGDGCDAAGQRVPFPHTKAERRATGDPRLSLEERYLTHEDYLRRVAEAAKKLNRERFLLEEDVRRYLDAARQSTVPNFE